MATPTTQDVNPEGTAAQNSLLYTGRPAVIASTWKAYASLANNQTFIVAENSSGTPSLVTFEIEKSASGWTPTGGAVVVIDCTAAATLVELLAIVRDFLNARPNAAYVWAINGTSDGLVGTAKFVGDEWNYAPTGTTLTASGISTIGTDSAISKATAISSLFPISIGPSPVFVSNAATIAPGTDRASQYVIPSNQTLSGAGTLTLASTGTPSIGPKLIACYALALGQILSIVNGPSASTIASLPASLTGPRGVIVNWDGYNYSLVGYLEGVA